MTVSGFRVQGRLVLFVLLVLFVRFVGGFEESVTGRLGALGSGQAYG